MAMLFQLKFEEEQQDCTSQMLLGRVSEMYAKKFNKRKSNQKSKRKSIRKSSTRKSKQANSVQNIASLNQTPKKTKETQNNPRAPCDTLPTMERKEKIEKDAVYSERKRQDGPPDANLKFEGPGRTHRTIPTRQAWHLETDYTRGDNINVSGRSIDKATRYGDDNTLSISGDSDNEPEAPNIPYSFAGPDSAWYEGADYEYSQNIDHLICEEKIGHVETEFTRGDHADVSGNSIDKATRHGDDNTLSISGDSDNEPEAPKIPYSFAGTAYDWCEGADYEYSQNVDHPIFEEVSDSNEVEQVNNKNMDFIIDIE
jgi:hypothetical protein